MSHPFLPTSLALLAASALSAQVLMVEYPLDNTTVSYAPGTVAPGVLASDINNSAGGSLSGSALSYFRTNSGNPIPESLDVAVTNNVFIGFTLTPDSSTIDIASVRFAFGLSNNTTSVDPYQGNWALYSSLTGFSTADLIASGDWTRAKATSVAPAWQDPAPVVSLAGNPLFQDLTAPVEFRLYFWDNSTVSTSNLVIRFDTVQVTGDVSVIPEPGTLALAALGGLAVLGAASTRRRR